MRISVPYGEGHLRFKIKEDNLLSFLEEMHLQPAGIVEEALKLAFSGKEPSAKVIVMPRVTSLLASIRSN